MADRPQFAQELLNRHLGFDHVARSAGKGQIRGIESPPIVKPLLRDKMIDLEPQSSRRPRGTCLFVHTPRRAPTVRAPVPCRIEQKCSLKMRLEFRRAPLTARSASTLPHPEVDQVLPLGRRHQVVPSRASSQNGQHAIP
ncbi:MAG TPA: hypothetical protein VFX12_14675 [Vicinamibacterales bacterium]|nr:hypothetical protein [Vicinamibacterales bacterium]